MVVCRADLIAPLFVLKVLDTRPEVCNLAMCVTNRQAAVSWEPKTKIIFTCNGPIFGMGVVPFIQVLFRTILGRIV